MAHMNVTVERRVQSSDA